VTSSPVVMLAWLAATLLFLLALRGWFDLGSARRSGRMGMAGVALAVGVTLYTHDVVSLPEILGAITVGGGIGYLLVRHTALGAMLPILAGLQALGGLALLLTALGICRNPVAFDVLAPGDADLTVTSRLLAGLALILGGVIVAGALLACRALIGRRSAGGAPAMPALLATLSGLAGGGAAALGALLGEGGLMTAGAIVGAAGLTLGARLAFARRD
jgi:H+-translocating NAD(P) transhydrogenase subunit beta